MADEILKRDENHEPVIGLVTDDAAQEIRMGRIDDTTKGLKVMIVGGAGAGTVTEINGGTGILLTPDPIETTGEVALATALQPMATLTGNSLKYLRVNVGETAVEYATVAGGGITIGTTTITSGATTRILYDNAGVVGEYTISGSGTIVAMATAPTFGTSITGSYLTASEILITDGSKNIVSAAVATYPSLTELSYVKGVTSAIQTQINAKQATGNYITALTGNVTATGPGSVAATIANDAVTLAMMASGTDGNLITYDANGDPAYVATGNAGEVLTSNGAGAAPTFQAAAGGGANTALSNLASVAVNTTLVSDTDNTDALGTTAIAWSDLFLGSGAVVTFNSAPSTPDITITHSADTLTFAGGTVVLGVASATTYNGLTVTANGTNTLNISAGKTVVHTAGTTFAGTDGKTLTVTNSIALAGTDSTVMTFPSTSATIARTDAGQTFTGVQVMTSPSITTANLTGTQLLAEGASIGLDPSGSADGAYSGITITATAGYSQAFGDLVYLSSADSRWEAADADAATTADRLLAMVVVAGTDGNACTLLMSGTIRADAKFPTLTIGSAVYVGEAAGEIQVAIPTGADNVIRRVGYALTADSIYFNPSMDSQTSVA